MEHIIELWHNFLALTDFIPIDLILLLLIAFMFGRFVWVMAHRTRMWDNLSRSMIAVFGTVCLTFLYLGINIITDPYPGQEIILWSLRLLLFGSITWCQLELSRELRKVPGILFVRDRQWVRRRINNIELIRTLLKTHSDTPEGLIVALDAELDEMYRFKEVVWREDQKHGVESEPEWTKNPYYVESHGLGFDGEPTERDIFATLLKHEPLATPGDDYPGQGGENSK